ncbi:MAG: hypothetical protein C0606_08375 [Hyphomicrobiales bacterium]|nr:MAG: hypothetical protein C0606_08375 [Hyphomicrobiales bacterium]
MQFLVTRPKPGAGKTAAMLKAKGHRAIVDPMLKIVFDDTAPIALDGVQAIAATSANAVRALGARSDKAALTALPLFTVGKATARAAENAGFTKVISADGDVMALAGLVSNTLEAGDGPVLYAGGRDRKGDLEGLLRNLGFEMRLAEVYAAEPASDLGEKTVEALKAGKLGGALIFSARTGTALIAAANKAGLDQALKGVRVIAISKAAAKPFEDLGCEKIRVAKKPNARAMMALIKDAGQKAVAAG